MLLSLFETLIAAHIVTGTIGAVAFWVPVLGRKGEARHRRWGAVFTFALLATGCLALAMSTLTLIAPVATHPHLEGRFDEAFIRGMFGWLMQTTGLLTIVLAWHGWVVIRARRDRARARGAMTLGLHLSLVPVSLHCAFQGWWIDQPLLFGIAAVGLATVGTDLHYLFARDPGPGAWIKEHLKALVGAGISVYTAFLAFGSVRLLPELALNPVLWAVPLTIGVALIVWHRRAVDRQFAGRSVHAGVAD